MAARLAPPGPRGLPLVGHLVAYYRDPIGFLQRLARQYGDVVHFKVGPRDVVLLNHPDYVEDVLLTHQRSFTKGGSLRQSKRFLGEGLLTSEGELHRRQRRLARPAFHRDRLAGYGTIMVEQAGRLRRRWRDGATVDIAHEMAWLALPIVGRTLFGLDVEAGAGRLGRPVREGTAFTRTTARPLAGARLKLPLPASRRFRRADARLDAALYRMIAERRAGGEDRGDLLSGLLLARDDEGRGLSDRQVRDEVVTFLLAGHETVSMALTVCWYLLSQHPAAEAALHAELDAALAGRVPTVEDVARLPYTRMVFAEALRLYPPIWAVTRRAIRDCPIGPYVLPAGSIALMSPYLLHRDARYFSEPLRFEPRRWAAERPGGRPRFSYFPFGGGARGCIGEAFGWLEGVLVLATLAQAWRPRLARSRALALEPLLTMRPKHPVLMTLERRTAAPDAAGSA